MKKIKLGIAAMALAGTLTAGCGPQGAYSSLTDRYDNSECQASTDNGSTFPTSDGTGITITRTKLINYVTGHVYIICDPRPKQHILDMELWFHPLSGGSFEKKNSITYKSIPGAAEETGFTLSHWCMPGIWEVRWSVVGRDSVGEPFAYSAHWTYAFVKSIDCTEDPGPSTEPSPEGGPVVVE
jgi:hypothetical protein